MIIKKNAGQCFKVQNQYYYRFQSTIILVLISYQSYKLTKQ